MAAPQFVGQTKPVGQYSLNSRAIFASQSGNMKINGTNYKSYYMKINGTNSVNFVGNSVNFVENMLSNRIFS